MDRGAETKPIEAARGCAAIITRGEAVGRRGGTDGTDYTDRGCRLSAGPARLILSAQGMPWVACRHDDSSLKGSFFSHVEGDQRPSLRHSTTPTPILVRD